MTEIHLEPIDAVELSQMLTMLANWITGHQRPTLAASLAAFVGHDAYGIDELQNDIHRLVFLLGQSDHQKLSGEPAP